MTDNVWKLQCYGIMAKHSGRQATLIITLLLKLQKPTQSLSMSKRDHVVYAVIPSSSASLLLTFDGLHVTAAECDSWAV